MIVQMQMKLDANIDQGEGGRLVEQDEQQYCINMMNICMTV
jgi:hypothetical protein